MNSKRIVRRQHSLPPDAPLFERLYAARGISNTGELDDSLKGLLPPALKGIDEAAELLADAVMADAAILIVGDFDADGATSCALMVSALRAFGASQVNYLVPDRFRFGYGLTPEIVDVAVEFQPDVLVTVDNGIASIDGVARANSLGVTVIVTDHHLPGSELPDAAAIVNPNQPGCSFPSKSLAGVGVAFYLLSRVRVALREAGWFADSNEPSMATWLDLVALGTVADVVTLDQNNRRLVSEGIRRIRAGRCSAGITALLEVAGCDANTVTSRDLAFSLAPRLNAAGRLQDMTVGIECLMADEARAPELAAKLDALNAERKEIEAEMREKALAQVDQLDLGKVLTGGLCLYEPDWHQGIVGIVASRVKDRSHRPVIAFAKTGEDELKGSARSVPGFHIRDALDAIATANPGLITKFGGHAMAAGLTLAETSFEAFRRAFDAVVADKLGEATVEQVVETDGELHEAVTIELARQLETAAPWGQGFPEPQFDDVFEILEQRIVGGRHLRLLLQPPLGGPVEGIYFNRGSLLEERRVRCAYRVEVNRYRGFEKPQLVVTLAL